MDKFFNTIKKNSVEELTTAVKFCGGTVVLVLFALYIQNGFALYNHASPAAVAYWQQSTGWNGSTNYPSPGVTAACVWDNSTAKVAGGEQDVNCYWNPITAILDAQPIGQSVNGRMAYAQYWCSTQPNNYSCGAYTKTNGTATPLLVAASSQVQLDWACQPNQSATVYDSGGIAHSYGPTIYTTAGSSVINNGVSTGGVLFGSTIVTAPASGSTTYVLTCSGGTGGPYTASVMLIAETISISSSVVSAPSTPLTPANTVYSGGQAQINWSSSGLKAASCTLTGPTVSTSTPAIIPPTSWTNLSSGFSDPTSTLPFIDSATIAKGPTHDYLMGGSNFMKLTQDITGVYYAPASNPSGWKDTGGRLPALAGAQSAVVGNTIYFFGGYDYATHINSSAIYSAPVSNPGAWTNTGQHLPTALAFSQIYNDGTNLYLIGGAADVAFASTRNVYYASLSNPLVWNTVTNVLPVAADHATLVKGGSYIYLTAVGGNYNQIYRTSAATPTSGWALVGTDPLYNYFSYPAYVDATNNYMYLYHGNVYRAPLSTSMNTWTNLGSVPPLQFANIVQAPNGNIYAVGGYNSSGSNEYMLNPTASTTLWMPGGPLLPATINQNTLYTVGGQYYAGGSNGMLMTAPVSSPTSWSVVNQTYNTYTLSSSYQPGGPWTQNVVPQNFVYANPNNGDLYSSVVTYTSYLPLGYSQSTTIGASSTSPTNWHMLVGGTPAYLGYGGLQVGNTWYLLGGQIMVGNANYNSTTGAIYQTTPTNPQLWTSTGSSLPSTLTSFPLVTDTANNRAYVIGGVNNNTPSSATYFASLNTPTAWSTSGTLPVPLQGATAGIFQDSNGTNRIYVFGGMTTGGVNSQAIYQSAPLSSSGTLTPWTNVGTIPVTFLNTPPMVTYNNVAYILGSSILSAPLTDTNNGLAVTAPLTQNTTFTLSCLDMQGNTVATSTTIYVALPPAPTCSITSVTPPSVSGGTATINYTTTNSPTSGSVDNSIGSFTPVNPSGALASGPITFTGSIQNITYTMTVVGSGGTGMCSGSVTIPAGDICTDIAGNQTTVPANCLTPSPSPGSCTDATHVYNAGTSSCNIPPTFVGSGLTAAPSRLVKGLTAHLVWDVTNLTPGTSCSFSTLPSVTTVPSAWNGSGTEYKSPTGGWQTAAITQKTIFTLSCTNATGAKSSSATVSLVPITTEI